MPLAPDPEAAEVARRLGYTNPPARYLRFGGPWPPPLHIRPHWLLRRWCRLCRELAEDAQP